MTLALLSLDEYKIATGWNNAGALALLAPQPRSVQQQVTAGLVRDGLDGTNAEDGLYVEIRYSVLSTTELASLNSQFGVSSASSAQMTIRVKLRDTYTNYNTVVRRPLAGKTAIRDVGRWRDVTYVCTRLVAI